MKVVALDIREFRTDDSGVGCNIIDEKERVGRESATCSCMYTYATTHAMMIFYAPMLGSSAALQSVRLSSTSGFDGTTKD
jgi:hypothetical protein